MPFAHASRDACDASTPKALHPPLHACMPGPRTCMPRLQGIRALVRFGWFRFEARDAVLHTSGRTSSAGRELRLCTPATTDREPECVNGARWPRIAPRRHFGQVRPLTSGCPLQGQDRRQCAMCHAVHRAISLGAHNDGRRTTGFALQRPWFLCCITGLCAFIFRLLTNRVSHVRWVAK